MEFRLVSVGDEMTSRDVEMAACCWTCEGLCLVGPVRGMLYISNLCSTGIPRRKSIN